MAQLKPNPNRVSKPARGVVERLSNARKLGEREETDTEILSQAQLSDMRIEICSRLWDLEAAREAKKRAAEKHRAKIKELDAAIADMNRAVRVGKRDVPIIVEEWLTDRNEVIRVRADTQEIIGTRVATIADMQDDMFEDEDADDEADADEVPDGSIAGGEVEEKSDFGDGEATH